MKDKNQNSQRFYKICAAIGMLIILIDIGISWARIQAFENTVSTVFESMITTQMELDGLKNELIHIDKVLEIAATSINNNIEVDSVKYTAYEVERIKNEKSSIQLYVQEKELDILGMTSAKKNIMNEVRILFIASLMFLVIGTLLAVFGLIAWYFQIEFFEDRRKKARK